MSIQTQSLPPVILPVTGSNPNGAQVSNSAADLNLINQLLAELSDEPKAPANNKVNVAEKAVELLQDLLNTPDVQSTLSPDQISALQQDLNTMQGIIDHFDSTDPASVATDVKSMQNTSSAFVSKLVVAMGNGGAIMLAFQAIFKYLRELMEQNGAAANMFASLNTNPNTSFYNAFLKSGISAANSQGDALTDQAWGQLATAIFSGATLGLSLGAEGHNSTMKGLFSDKGTEIPQQQEGATAYKNLFSQKANSDLIAGDAGVDGADAAQKPQMSPELQARMDEITDGSYNIGSYKGADENGKLSADDERTKQAINNLTKEQRKDAFKNAEKYSDSIEGKQNQLNSAQQKFMNYMDQLNRGGSAAASGAASMYQAQDTTKAGIASAEKDLGQMLVQNNDQMKEKNLQNQQTDRDQMNSALQQLTSALVSSTKGGGG